MDRRHLGAWSLGIDDERFVAALAALGVLQDFDRKAPGHALPPELSQRIAAVDAADPAPTVPAFVELLHAIAAWQRLHADAAQAGAAAGLLGWSVPPTPEAGAHAPVCLRKWPSAAHLADAWNAFAADASSLRLEVRGDDEHDERMLDFVELLSHDAARLTGVHAVASWTPQRPTEWRWPFTIATLPDDSLGEGLAAAWAGDAEAPPDARVVIASRRTPRVEALALGHPLPRALARALEAASPPRCALAIVAAPGPESPTRSAPLLRALAAHLQADGVVVAPGMPRDRFIGALRQFTGQMSSGCPLDIALMRSMGPGHVAWLGAALIERSERAPARQAARAARASPLPSASPRAPAADRTARRNSNFPDWRPRLRPAAPSGASHPIPAPPPPPPPPRGARDDERRPARHLQQRSLRKAGDTLEAIRDGYVRGEPVMLCVRIGAREDASWDSAPTPFPEHELPKDRDVHTLQVVVHEPDQFDEPMLREIELPRVGPSSEARFVFTPRRTGAFDARISVLHRGRVLQTARLRTRVREHRDQRGDGIALLDEAQVREDWSDLGARRRFDLALVLNHGEADGTPRLTAVAERRAWATSLEGIADPLLQLNGALPDAAHSIADHADGLDQGENPQLLVRLARIGADLYSALCLDQFAELAHGGFDPRVDALTHIQVISARADAVVPIEFFYDYPPPASDAQRVCPGHREALKTGRCPSGCAGRADPAAYVCPMGFWGLRKVIERHVYSPALGRPDGAEVVIQAEPAEGRDRLDLGRCAVLGFSAQVPKEARTPLLELLSPRFGDATLEAATWTAWKDTVGERKPALLVAFPHNEGRRQDMKLEIGGDFLSTLRLPRDYVRPEGAPPPIVFLLGCDVASTAEPFSNHIRYFRQAGAAVVISTMATVFGTHAVAVGSKIIARLLRAGGAEADQLGELVLDARREALLDSLPVALCIVAFGDADWRL